MDLYATACTQAKVIWLDNDNPLSGDEIEFEKERGYWHWPSKELSYRNAGANGAAMRVLPIALVNMSNETRLYRDTFINSIITHGHPRAILGSIIYASAINYLAKEIKISKEIGEKGLQASKVWVIRNNNT